MPTPSSSESAAEPLPLATRDALQLLLDGHEHLRRHTALALSLGHGPETRLATLAETASRLVRYFTLGLTLHFEEEDFDLVPRLFAAGLAEENYKHLWEMGRQHEDIELQVDELVPLWARVRDTPERYAEVAGRLREGSRRLADLVEEHLGLEERHIFPLIRSLLSPETRAVIAREMLDRRGQLT